jgi:predicted DNA-binding protein
MDDQLTFRIPRDLARALARRAKERGVPRAHVVREALATYLAETEPASPEELKRRLKRFIGAVELKPLSEADEVTRQIYEHNWRA